MHNKLHLINNTAPSAIDKMSTQIRAYSNGNKAPWRCLYTTLSSKLTQNPSTRNIISSLLKSSFEQSADDVRAFWLASGELFLFFRGPVRAVVRDYELFLDFANQGERPDYEFFWEIDEPQGEYSQLLKSIKHQGIPPAKNSSNLEPLPLQTPANQQHKQAV